MSEKVFIIQEDPICGRQLIAKRKILAGEVIIDEPALLTGPGYGGNDATCIKSDDENDEQNKMQIGKFFINEEDKTDDFICLVCCANIKASMSIQCTKCLLILCNEQCSNHFQHTSNECLVFPKIRNVWNQKPNRSKKAFYNLVLTIRSLFFKFRDSTKWAQIKMLESKTKALKRAGAFRELEDIFNSLSWEMFASSSEINENIENNLENEECIADAAQHCLGVMRINAFSNFSESYSRDGLFFFTSFISHRCFINTDRQIEAFSSDVDVFGCGGVEFKSCGSVWDNARMVVRASVDIEKDEPISTTYLSLLYNTHERNRIMLSSWLFMCHCQRCKDPTELNVFPVKSTHSPDRGLGANDAVISKILESRPKDLREITKIEEWLDRCDNGNLLHPNHSIFTHLKLFLSQYYGRQGGGIDLLHVNRIKRKVQYCQQILNIYDIVAPGIQMCRGILLFELWCGLFKLEELQQLPIKAHHPPPNQFDELYVRKIKLEAIQILKFALPNSPEELMFHALKCDETDDEIPL